MASRAFTPPQFAGRCRLAKLHDHRPRGRFDRRLPTGIAELVPIFRPGVRENDASRAIHDRPEATIVERPGHVGRRSALAAKAGDQEPRVRHGLP